MLCTNILAYSNYILKFAILSLFISLLKYIFHINEITPFLIVIAHKNNGISLNISSTLEKSSWKHPLFEDPCWLEREFRGEPTISFRVPWWRFQLAEFVSGIVCAWATLETMGAPMDVKFQSDFLIFFCGCIENLNQTPALRDKTVLLLVH